MSHRLFACGVACTIALGVAGSGRILAQEPQPQTPAASRAADAAQAGQVRIEGCLMKEVDVPGRKPPEELRQTAEIDDDLVLTDTKMVQDAGGAAPAPRPDAPVGTSGTGGTAGTSTGASSGPSVMYKVKGLDASELEGNIGQRVQITGTLEHTDRAQSQVSFATDLVRLQATSIQRADGNCPAERKK